MLQICSMCLSRDRRLTPLRSLKRILDCITWLHIELNMDRDHVCWECRAMLAKIQRFQRQAVRAQYMLALHRSTAQPEQTLESHSKLSIHTKTSVDVSVLYEEAVKLKTEDYHNYEYLDDDLTKVEEGNLTSENNYSTFAIKQEINEIAEESNISDDDEQIPGPKLAINENISDEDEELEPKLGENRDVTKSREQPAPKLAIDENFSDEEESEPELDENKDLKKPREQSDKFIHLTKDEQKFIVQRMTLQEVYKVRDVERTNKRYRACPYKCINCIKSFFSKEKYDNHVENFHSEDLGPLSCPICLSRFIEPGALRRHSEAHMKRYACRECTFAHHRLSAALAHVDVEHAVYTYPCKFCDEGFFSSRRLRYHTDKMHKARPKCKMCNKTFVTANVLKIHTMAVHSKALLKECPQCGGKYRQLRAHMRVHAPARGGEDAYCAECGRQFRNAYIYHNHLKTHARHRQPDALRYACEICDAKFTNATSLTRHISSKHTKLYAFSCDTCGKGYHRRDRLQIHIQEKHEGVARPKDKICTYCDKAFKDSMVLKNHVRTHTGEKPYACAQCPWRFAQRSTLQTHVRALHRQKSKPEQAG